MTVAIIFYAHFIASKTGKTGLTVTVDVESVAKADGAKAVVVTGASASEGVDGMYYYRYATADLSTYDYFAVFKTADATVDVQHVPALWSNYSINADAGIAATAPASTALTNATWTDARAGKIDYLDASVNAVKVKTDNLPASPAATSDIPTANITAIKAKTDNLPASPAATGDIPNAAAIAADVQTGLTVQGYTTTRAGYLDVLNGLVAAIWANGSRTLTANPGLTMADIRTAIGMAAANLDALIAAIPGAVNTTLSGIHGAGVWGGAAGSGPAQFVYTVTDADTHLPVAMVFVFATTDAAGTNRVAQGYTDAFGHVTFWLDPGTYYFWRYNPEYDFTNPDTEVVA